jgi:hypothetical protein
MAERSMTKEYRYATRCVDSTAEAINAMTEKARESSLETLRRHCIGLEEWERSMGYDTGHKRGGLRLKDDRYVAYFKSRYRGRPCYYIVHSAIEFIWTL